MTSDQDQTKLKILYESVCSQLLIVLGKRAIYSSSHAHFPATQETNQTHFFNFIVWFLLMPIVEPMEYCRCFGFRKGRKYRGSGSMQKLQPSRTSTDPELPSGLCSFISSFFVWFIWCGSWVFPFYEFWNWVLR